MSFSKDSITVQFAGKNGDFSYEFKFIDGELIISTGNAIKVSSKNKHNAIVQFKELTNQKAEKVSWGLFDRIITIYFSSGHKLILKGFGRYSNLLMFEPHAELPESIFRLNFKNDWDFKFPFSPEITWVLNDGNLPKIEVSNYLNAFNKIEFTRQFKSLSTEEIESIFQPRFFEMNVSEQINELRNLDLKNKKMLGYRSNEGFYLAEIQYDVNVHQKSNWGDFLYGFFRNYIRVFYFQKRKNELKNRLEKEIKQHSSQVKNLTSRIEEISKRRSFKELGDLILTNAHSIKKGTSEALVSDYYTGHRIRIKLNSELSAAENAEKFYRKAKNESMELSVFEENLAFNKEQLDIKRNCYLKLESSENQKHLNEIEEKLKNKPKQELKSKSLPYRIYDFQGFEIWVGKNAKSNDELLRLSKKNDLWLHALGVFGSHVIIRKKLREYPLNVICFAAELAAFYSKGKHQGLQTVMFAERKFVSKVKGAASGQVNVLQFQTIDVEPKNHS